MSRHFTRRLGWLLAGLAGYGMAIALMVQAAIGLSPWDVLAQGISRRSGVPFGLVTDAVGLAVLLFWFPLRQRPGIGTLLNMLLIGLVAQLGLWLIPAPAALWIRIPMFAAGLLLLAVSTGAYIAPRLGPGPRDGLMIGLHARTGWPIWAIRAAIEITVLVVGWILGGQVGVGTLAEAFLIGPLVHRMLPLFAALLGRSVPASAAAEGSRTDPAGRSGAPGRAAPLPAGTGDAERTPGPRR